MCGRISNHEELDRNARDFDADVDAHLTWAPRYNVAPTQPVLVLGARDGRRVLRALRWGLVPSWAKDVSIGAQCINARSETLATKPAFRAAYAKRRGVVLATGWFEWRAGAVKIPHWFHEPAGRILALAALWEAWRDPATGEELRTCTVVTRAAGPLVATVHDREPVRLDGDALARWLDPTASRGELDALLAARGPEAVAVHEVARGVGNVRNDGPSLVLPVRAVAA